MGLKIVADMELRDFVLKVHGMESLTLTLGHAVALF